MQLSTSIFELKLKNMKKTQKKEYRVTLIVQNILVLTKPLNNF